MRAPHVEAKYQNETVTLPQWKYNYPKCLYCDELARPAYPKIFQEISKFFSFTIYLVY